MKRSFAEVVGEFDLETQLDAPPDDLTLTQHLELIMLDVPVPSIDGDCTPTPSRKGAQW